ncbi:MAG TPA: hypothetical protein VLT45_07385, partial [Kofleriaceae bacterium]|nr:hypothetical protein [Kofleriaceae bacterium]
MVLLLVALAELAINRVAIGTRTEPGLVSVRLAPSTTPPGWYTALSYVGLFLFYFAGTLAFAVLVSRVLAFVRGNVRDKIAGGALLVTGVLAALPLVLTGSSDLSFALEIAFAVTVVLLMIATFGKQRDLGVQLGIVLLVVPMLEHTLAVIGAKFLWPDAAFDTPGQLVAKAAALSLCLAALVSPYLFAPRPFSRAVTRPGPVLVAMAVAATGAVLARTWYLTVAKGATLAIGVELTTTQADPRLALYLLAIATLVWTLASCVFAESPARRQIGAGIALLVLGGYGFRWPHHYLLPLVGLALIADASRRVRDEELDALPIATETPAIADPAWQSYIAGVRRGLEKSLGGLQSLSMRGEQGVVSSLIMGERDGIAVRVRIERIEGSVAALDVVVGRELDEVRAATLTLWGIPPRALGINPAGPPAAPLFKTGDEQLDERFKVRGSALAFNKLFDDGLRARAAATLDGWLAYWENEGLRYRVYPGRGAPLDHPMPLSDLALARPATADRLVAVVELLADIAIRGVRPESA